jgi:hypothetical protein
VSSAFHFTFFFTLIRSLVQVFHGIYNTYDEAMSWPGVLWNNLFFLLSLVTMVIALAVEGIEDNSIRRMNPTKFPPTASTVVLDYIMKSSSK